MNIQSMESYKKSEARVSIEFDEIFTFQTKMENIDAATGVCEWYWINRGYSYVRKVDAINRLVTCVTCEPLVYDRLCQLFGRLARQPG